MFYLSLRQVQVLSFHDLTYVSLIVIVGALSQRSKRPEITMAKGENFEISQANSSSQAVSVGKKTSNDLGQALHCMRRVAFI